MSIIMALLPVFLMGAGGGLSSPITEVAGPFELQGSLMAFLLFIFTFFIIIGKKRIIRVMASFLCAVTGGFGLAFYLINQLSVGNPLSVGPIAIFAGGVVYGLLIGIIMVIKNERQKELTRQAMEKRESEPPTRRKFDD